MDNNLTFSVCIGARGRYGVKVCDSSGKPKREWWIKPVYEAIRYISDKTTHTWFKLNGKYGYLDILTKEEVIPAEYGYPLYFSNGYAETWKDYRAGVIDISGKTVIPFQFDEIKSRVKPSNQGGSENIFRGFICSCEDGTRQFFNENLQPDELKEWDQVGREPHIADQDNEALSIGELEDKIRENFRKLIEIGYNTPLEYCFSSEHCDEIEKLEEIVKNAIWDRKRKMDSFWRHTRENVAGIGRMNDLLMKATRKAISLGKKTAKSLQWMEKVPNTEDYSVKVYVYPCWQDDLSEMDIRDIITRMGEMPNCDGITPCFEHISRNYDSRDWNYRDCIVDDGQSWDEMIHYPVYQDVYFLHPFHLLYCDLFNYSFEDLVSIRDFRVEVKVELQTKVQDKKIID